MNLASNIPILKHQHKGFTIDRFTVRMVKETIILIEKFVFGRFRIFVTPWKLTPFDGQFYHTKTIEMTYKDLMSTSNVYIYFW